MLLDTWDPQVELVLLVQLVRLEFEEIPVEQVALEQRDKEEREENVGSLVERDKLVLLGVLDIRGQPA